MLTNIQTHEEGSVMRSEKSKKKMNATHTHTANKTATSSTEQRHKHNQKKYCYFYCKIKQKLKKNLLIISNDVHCLDSKIVCLQQVYQSVHHFSRPCYVTMHLRNEFRTWEIFSDPKIFMSLFNEKKLFDI